MLDAGLEDLRLFQFILLPGTEAGDVVSRRRYEFSGSARRWVSADQPPAPVAPGPAHPALDANLDRPLLGEGATPVDPVPAPVAVPRQSAAIARRALPVMRTVGSMALVAASTGIGGGPGDRATARRSVVRPAVVMARATSVARIRREAADWAIAPSVLVRVPRFG
jgi:hypothetical protein